VFGIPNKVWVSEHPTKDILAHQANWWYCGISFIDSIWCYLYIKWPQ